MNTEQLYSRILPFVPGCPEPAVDLAIMDAAAEFAEATQADYTLERPIALREGQRTYFVFGSGGVEVDLVREVWLNDREVIRATTAQLHDAMPNWQTAESSEPTHFNTIGEPGSISVYPLPRNVQPGVTLRVLVTWKPGIDARNLPDTLGRAYYREIAEGAKAALMLQPDRKWTNPQMAAVCQRKFEDGKNQALLKAIHQGSAGSLSVRPVRFGA